MNILINAALDNKLYNITYYYLIYITQKYICKNIIVAFKAIKLNSYNKKLFQLACINNKVLKNKSKQQLRRNITCYYYNQKGHIKRNCFDKTLTEKFSKENINKKKRKKKKELRKSFFFNKNYKNKNNKNLKNSGKSKNKRLDAKVAKNFNIANKCNFIFNIVKDIICLRAIVAENVNNFKFGLKVL